MKKKILWITDPWHTLDHPRDTTLRLADEALHLGIETYWADVQTIRFEKSQVLVDTHKLLFSGKLGQKQTHQINSFLSIHYRTDPPIDLAYLQPLQLIYLGLKLSSKKPEIVNPLEVLFQHNEKLEPSMMKQLMPPSVVSSQWDVLLKFGKSEGRTVLKPLHQAQSNGVELLDWRNSDGVQAAQLTLRKSTHQFSRPVLLQRYLEGIAEGETRLWFLDGKLLAYVKKLPLTGDFRVNLDRGSQIAPTRLTSTEKKKAEIISKHLKKRQIRLAAVDLIENFATDFNFTSPGLIPLMEKVLQTNLAKPIVKAISVNLR